MKPCHCPAPVVCGALLKRAANQGRADAGEAFFSSGWPVMHPYTPFLPPPVHAGDRRETFWIF